MPLCNVFILFNSPTKVFLLELLELLLREQRLWLLDLFGTLFRSIPGLPPYIMTQNLNQSEKTQHDEPI